MVLIEHMAGYQLARALPRMTPRLVPSPRSSFHRGWEAGPLLARVARVSWSTRTGVALALAVLVAGSSTGVPSTASALGTHAVPVLTGPRNGEVYAVSPGRSTGEEAASPPLQTSTSAGLAISPTPTVAVPIVAESATPTVAQDPREKEYQKACTGSPLTELVTFRPMERQQVLKLRISAVALGRESAC